MQDRSLHTPEMDHAERELNARAEYALSVGRELEAQTKEFEERFAEKEPPSDEDVERLKKFILGHAMTEQWRQVVERINRGELTWREIADGLFHGTLPPDVAAAFRSLGRVPPASQEDLVAIGVLEPVPGAQTAAPVEEPEAADSRKPSGDDDDDEWFDEDPLGRVTR
jgi:hypothetical protein